MSPLPLVSHATPDSIIAWRADGAVTLRQFLSEVRQLAALFPAGGKLLNLCSDRYRFSVGLAAAIVAGKVSLLPPAQTPEMLRQIKVFAPDVFCLTDSDRYMVDLPHLRYPDMDVNQADTFAIPQIDRQQRIAVVFTSGSTGTPQPHPKTWGALVSSVQAEAARLGLLQDTHCTLVGTVPPQHMYGFESTVLMAWHSGNALSHAQPFYPADICQALAAVPMPRALISSPVHLRALLDAELALPELSLVLSATAPLSANLACDIEARCHAPLMEIYGSTETGLIATRRPTQTAQWHLLPGIRLRVEGDRVRACGGHIETQIPMNDRIEIISDEYFLLHGRMADLINIAGKRHSLASLNHLLNSIAGVVDGVFFMPDETSPDHITRLAACVVAPGMDAPRLLAALREQIDPVFLPRPLLFVDALPRNSTGKLPRAALQALFQTQSTRQTA
ncbi:MAG: AMP-binding protein [Pseudomonadota bacterium]